MSTINVNFSDLAEFYPDGTHVTRGVYIHSTGSAVSAVGSVPTVSVLTEETNTPSDWLSSAILGSSYELQRGRPFEGRGICKYDKNVLCKRYRNGKGLY